MPSFHVKAAPGAVPQMCNWGDGTPRNASLLGMAYTVLDITGRPMLEGVISPHALDVSIVDLASGIYTITVRGEISAERFIMR